MSQPITWQNVGLPQNMGANYLLTMAQEQYANAFQGLENIATGFRKDNIATDTANSEAQLNWFTEQARNLKPEQFTPETMNTLLANVTDPAARQAAVGSFGKLGDEALTRDKTKFDFSEAQKTADFNAALRPHELDKAALGDDLIKAQMAAEAAQRTSAYASANASNASAAASNLQTEGLQLKLADAKDARAKTKAWDGILDTVNTRLAAGSKPADELAQLKKIPGMTTEGLTYLVPKFNNLVNTQQTLDPVTQKDLAEGVTTLQTAAKTQTAAIQSWKQEVQKQHPVDPLFSAMVGQKDVTKQIDTMASGAGNANTSMLGGSPFGYIDAEYVAPAAKAGLDATSANFTESLDTALTPLVSDPEERKALIATAQRGDGLYTVQSLALKNIAYDTVDGKKIYKLSGDGREVIEEFNRMLKPYALSLANEHLNKKIAMDANAATLRVTQAEAEASKKATTAAQQAGGKGNQDLLNSLKDGLNKVNSSTTLGAPIGLVESGNIDLYTRPSVKNKDGSISTVRSMSVNVDGNEVLIPTVSDAGKIMTNDEAIETYKRTGRHLGKFKSVSAANNYAKELHEQQQRTYTK